MPEWYTIKNTEGLDTPALVIYPDRVAHNIELLKTFVDDVGKLRPHVKTSKSPDVVKLMLEAGIRKFKCATIAEGEMLATAGATDVLLAYQPVGPNVRRFCALQERFPETRFTCLIDNPKSLEQLSAISSEFKALTGVLIDLNVGMNRTGILPGKDAYQLYRRAREAPAIEFVGLHAYDGHLRDPDLNQRKQKCDESFRAVADLRKEIAADFEKDPLVIAGGTPTFPIHAKRPEVEASPGTFIFWDRGYQLILPEQPFEIAALVVTRVISRPDPQTICVDLGHKSIASENAITQRVHFLNAGALQAIGHSEEHLVLQVTDSREFEIGDILYGVPYHICPTVALYENARVCRENVAGEIWPIAARKRKITI
jgi:D-threonine aldolase